MDLVEKKISGEKIYSGRIINLYNDRVLLPNGHESQREYVTHNGGCSVVPITEDGCVLMVEQFRYPYHAVVLEIPAGKLEKGENPMDCAKRELREEVGGECDTLIDLGVMYPSVGYTNEIIRIYLAENVTIGETDPDDDEFLNVKKIPLNEAVDMIMRNELVDGKSIVGILKASRYLSK